ncbi:MAG: NADH-quinone oxidoreductase subunit H [Gammaproteobacteria bacterium]|nr:NADH-quinone oxidoreductase subunit H [Gammaproteobacteria bacterium]
MTTLLVLLLLAIGVYLLAVLENWIANGRFQLTAPAYSAIALLGRESVIPRKPDLLFFEVGPVLLLIAALLAAAVIPLSPDLIIADLATGALFLNAALAYILVALIMAGWGPNGAYAMIGGWRFLGQLVAYAMLIVMPITAVAMRAESLVTTDIVFSQAGLWNIVYQPLGFALFFIAAMGLAFLPPFDLPTAKGELAGGVEAEYSGVRLAIFRLGRMVLIITLAGATATFYLGGWQGPLLPDWIWSAIKIMLVTAAMLMVGKYVPRIRETHLLAWCWKFGIPLALLNIFIVGILIVVIP